jgi:hypothetical protein
MQQQLPIAETQNLALPEIVRRQADTQKEEEFQELYKEIREKEKGITGDTKIKKDFIFGIITFCIYYVGYSSLKLVENKNNIHFPIFMSLSMICTNILIRVLFQYIPVKKLYKKTKLLIVYNDLRSLGVVIRLADLSYTKRMQNDVFAILLPLLETLTKDDVQMLWFGNNKYFHENQQDSLQRLAIHPRIRREFPELMQAIIAALYTFHTAKNKEFLEKMAKEKPRRKEEQWIPKAAQSCLNAWETN